MSDYLKELKQEMSDGTLPEHWQGFAEKMVDDRGWPYPNESVELAVSEARKYNKPKLPITTDNLNLLMQLLLDLGINDSNSTISKLYFYLCSRLSSNDEKERFWNCDNASQLFKIGMEIRSEGETDLNKALPCEESVYQQIALLLGNLAKDDSAADDNTIPWAFLYLQGRARNGNLFRLNGEIDKIESDVIMMLEERKNRSSRNNK